MIEAIDQAQLNFSADSLWMLNICLGFIMFGVSLELKAAHFKEVLQQPKAILIGALAQFVLLPALTYLLCVLLEPHSSMALGMFLVASCPGGNVSNFMSLMAKGNAALSVSLTAVSTTASLVVTPLNFALWGGLYEPSAKLLQEIDINSYAIFKSILFLLGIPLVLGMLVNNFYPKFTASVSKGIRITSIGIFALFVLIAFVNNTAIFTTYFKAIVGLVFAHNLVALMGGFGISTLFGLKRSDRRSITLETGIQNSGLALVIIFNYFGGLGGMAIIAGWWGIWHLISGLSVSYLWSNKRLT